MSADLAQLTADLGSTDAIKRTQAAEQLSYLGPDAGPAAVALARAAGDEAEEVTEWAVSALEELGPPPVEQVVELVALLADGSPDVGYWAATLLGRLKAEAAAAVEPLVRVVAGQGDIALRQRAAWALGKIGPAAAAAIPTLQKAADDPSPRLARLVEKAIKQIGG